MSQLLFQELQISSPMRKAVYFEAHWLLSQQNCSDHHHCIGSS